MANMTELDRVVSFIATHPGQHAQDVWISQEIRPTDDRIWNCGTTACLAGWTALLNGWRSVRNNGDVVALGDVHASVGHVAQRILDLTDTQADYLFYGCATFDEVRRLVEVVRASPHADEATLLEAFDDE